MTREVHGVASDKEPTLTIWETDQHVMIKIGDLAHVGIAPESARHIASKMRRLARLIDERKKP